MLQIIDHPVTDHILAAARDSRTTPARFRRLLKRIGGLLAYEALRTAPQVEKQIDSPLEKVTAKRLAMPITIVPILRAGLGLADGAMELLPEAQVGHIGMFRDEQSLEAQSYYERLPANIADGVVLLVDPMLATGGSAVAAIRKLREKGCNDVRMICLVAAPEGVKHVEAEEPGIPITTAALDRELNDIGYILPGLGDAGDRLYGTE